MKAYIECYEKGNVIKIVGEDETVVGRFEVTDIHVELPASQIKAVAEKSGDRLWN
jgi:hypothetical protein